MQEKLWYLSQMEKLIPRLGSLWLGLLVGLVLPSWELHRRVNTNHAGYAEPIVIKAGSGQLQRQKVLFKTLPC